MFGVVFHEFDKAIEVQSDVQLSLLAPHTTRGIWVKPSTFKASYFDPSYEAFAIFYSNTYRLPTDLNHPRSTVFPCPYGDKSEIVMNDQGKMVNNC